MHRRTRHLLIDAQLIISLFQASEEHQQAEIKLSNEEYCYTYGKYLRRKLTESDGISQGVGLQGKSRPQGADGEGVG